MTNQPEHKWLCHFDNISYCYKTVKNLIHSKINKRMAKGLSVLG